MKPPRMPDAWKHRTRSAATSAVAALVLSQVWLAIGSSVPAMADTNIFQKAVNYVFTGSVEPKAQPEILDRASCVVLMRDPKYERYIRYNLKNFQMDTALYVKKYAGHRVYHELHVKGDDIVIAYVSIDRRTVTKQFRTAKISVPGDIDQTKKALRIIFSDYCIPQKPGEQF